MRLELLIGGMVSVHAKHAVFTALAAVDGVVRAEVELGRAELEFASGDASVAGTAANASAAAAASVATAEDAARAAIEAAGFTVLAVRRLPRILPTL